MQAADQRIVIVSDLQVPYHDPAAVHSLKTFLYAFQPTMLVNVGDDIDSPEVSQWSRGNAGEYAATLQEGIDATHEIHARFRDAVGDIPYHISRSNHGDRTQKYINRYAPALRSLRCLELSSLLGYEELGIIYHERPFEIAPGWICAHGDEGSFSKIAGRTAGLLSEKWGASVVCGHTHRAGIAFKSYGFNAQVTYDIAGMEVGHLMDVAKAGYLAGGSADWQQGFGILYVHDGRAWPVLVPVYDGGRFTVEGITYGT